MNSVHTVLAAMEPLPQWANFLAMALAILLVALGSLIWFLMFRKKRKRKRKHHNHEKRQLNPTLAECGGLPPLREERRSDAQTPQP
jgi:cytochrome c-type biogenesis protein CcmH/NrfF